MLLNAWLVHKKMSCGGCWLGLLASPRFGYTRGWGISVSLSCVLWTVHHSPWHSAVRYSVVRRRDFIFFPVSLSARVVVLSDDAWCGALNTEWPLCKRQFFIAHAAGCTYIPLIEVLYDHCKWLAGRHMLPAHQQWNWSSLTRGIGEQTRWVEENEELGMGEWEMCWVRGVDQGTCTRCYPLSRLGQKPAKELWQIQRDPLAIEGFIDR